MSVKKVAKNATKKAVKYSEKTVKNVTGSDDGKSLFFLILSMCCLWLILDVFYGNNLLKKVAQSIFGINDSDSGNVLDKDIISNPETNGAGVGINGTVNGTDNFGGSGGTHNSNGAGAGISGSNSKLETTGKNGAGLATGATKKESSENGSGGEH